MCIDLLTAWITDSHARACLPWRRPATVALGHLGTLWQDPLFVSATSAPEHDDEATPSLVPSPLCLPGGTTQKSVEAPGNVLERWSKALPHQMKISWALLSKDWWQAMVHSDDETHPNIHTTPPPTTMMTTAALNEPGGGSFTVCCQPCPRGWQGSHCILV
jgi:hypothetical protein